MKDLSNKNVIHLEKKGVQYLQFKRLLEYNDVINHVYTLGLDMGFKTSAINKEVDGLDKYNLAVDSYKRICNMMESDYINVVQANQNHTDKIKTVKVKTNKDKPDFSFIRDEIEDGLITNKNNIILSTTNADCILIMFFDPVKKIIANTHSGWRGTLQRICIKTVEKMVKEFDCKPEDIICCICPSIRKCHFEVDIDVKEMFQKEFKDLEGVSFINIDKNNQKQKISASDFIEEKIKNKKWNIDTVLINKIILQKVGIKPENIIDSGICSVCNSDIIHSYRVEKKNYKTETALIELK